MTALYFILWDTLRMMLTAVIAGKWIPTYCKQHTMQDHKNDGISIDELKLSQHFTETIICESDERRISFQQLVHVIGG